MMLSLAQVPVSPSSKDPIEILEKRCFKMVLKHGQDRN